MVVITASTRSIGKYSRLKQEEQEKRDAWEMLHKKMDNLNLSSAEQELIKRDIIHKESERYRQKYYSIEGDQLTNNTIN